MSAKPPRPSRAARALAALCLRGEAGEIVRGDLDEGFALRLAAGDSVRAARRRYWRQLIGSIGALHAGDSMSSGESRMSRVRGFQRFHVLRGLLADVRYAVRQLAASPGFTIVAVLSLGIGIGANTAIATLARAALFAPLKVTRPDQLDLVYMQLPKGARLMQMNSSSYQDPASGASLQSNYTYPMFRQVQAAVRDEADVFAFTFLRGASISIRGEPAIAVGGLIASGNYFNALGPRVELGRGFDPADDRPGADPVAVISHSLWVKAFGQSPGVLDASVALNGLPVRVIGVTGPGFYGVSGGGFFPETEVTLPLSLQSRVAPQWSQGGPLTSSDELYWLRVMARRRAGADAGQIQARADAALRGYLEARGIVAAGAADVGVRFLPGARGLGALRSDLRQSIVIMATIVAIVLFVACLNVASMTLARGVARQKEVALRRALGASRWRLIRTTLMESVLLAAGGAVAGLWLALLGRNVLIRMVTAGLGQVTLDLTWDLRLFLMTTGISFAAALVCGLLPALRLSGRRATEGLNTRQGGSMGTSMRLGRVMIAAQIAMSVPLIVGAGLLLRTVHNLGRVDLGFDPASLVVFTVDPSAAGTTVDPETSVATLQRVLDAVRGVPGVRSASLVENSLISGWVSNTTTRIDGKEQAMHMNAVGPGFFETQGIPLKQGRAPDERDRRGAPKVVVLNESAAALFAGSPIGQHLSVDMYDFSLRRTVSGDAEVIGIVADARYSSLRSGMVPTFYDAYAQRTNGPGAMHVVLRVSEPAAAMESPLRRAVAGVSAQLAVTGYTTQVEQISDSIGRERVFTRLLTIFGGFALLLACLGLHGVTSYAVARRTGEIGIRMALGAQRGQVLRMVIRQVVTLAVVGVTIGLPAAYWARPLIASFMFGVTAADPASFAIAALVMLTVALAAGFLPARRAASIDPLSAIRRD